MNNKSLKFVSFKREVLVPHELADIFIKYINKFGNFIFHTYLIDEDDMCKISKYRIIISKPTNPFNAVFNNVFEADIDFEVLEKHIKNKEIIKLRYKASLDLLLERNIHDNLIYSIQMYKFNDSLQAKIFAV